jgi:multicomponent Na+:H+ antiporter subunit B
MKKPFGSLVLDAACRLLVPFILLFALYVTAHGHYSPGGGFQGGTIIAAAFVTVRLVRGQGTVWGLRRLGALRLACGGVGLCAGIGLVSLFCAGNYLDYSALPLPLTGGALRAVGSFGVEVGVTMAVAGGLVLIFDVLTAWEDEEETEHVA